MSRVNRNIGKRLSDVGHLDKLIIDILTTTVVIFICVHNYQALSVGEKLTRIFLCCLAVWPQNIWFCNVFFHLCHIQIKKAPYILIV